MTHRSWRRVGNNWMNINRCGDIHIHCQPAGKHKIEQEYLYVQVDAAIIHPIHINTNSKTAKWVGGWWKAAMRNTLLAISHQPKAVDVENMSAGFLWCFIAELLSCTFVEWMGSDTQVDCICSLNWSNVVLRRPHRRKYSTCQYRIYCHSIASSYSLYPFLHHSGDLSIDLERPVYKSMAVNSASLSLFFFIYFQH